MSRISENRPDEDSQEKGGHSAAELLGVILPLIKDFVPIFLEKLSEATDRPTLRGLEEENRYLWEKIERLERRAQWLAMFQVVQALFFIFFVVLVGLKIL